MGSVVVARGREEVYAVHGPTKRELTGYRREPAVGTVEANRDASDMDVLEAAT
jgi:hypothetical protein